MEDPFRVLGIAPTADVEAVRHAYHQMAKKYHPDRFQGEEQQAMAHRRMVALNQAYTEALRLAEARTNAPYTAKVSCEDAIRLAEKMLSQGSPESALRQLLRAQQRSAAWYAEQGKILQQMGQWESAEQSYREAVRMDPDNVGYRRSALDALIALRKSKTVSGRLKKFFGR